MVLAVFLVVAFSAQASAAIQNRVRAVFVHRTNPAVIQARYNDGAVRPVLTVRQLPTESRWGFGIEARRFADAALSPTQSDVAFTTIGIVHGMLGILPLKTRKVRVLAGFFEGHADEIAWSPTGRFVAVTDHGPSGLREIQVYNVETAVAAERLGLVLEQRFMRRDLEVYRPLWSPDGTRIRFSVLALNRTPADRSQAWEIRLNGTGLRRLK